MIGGWGDWCVQAQLKRSCQIHARPHIPLAAHTCLLHTHPDVVGVDVVGSRHTVVHVMQGDTGRISWGGRGAAQVSRGKQGTPPASLPAGPVVSEMREEGAPSVQKGMSHQWREVTPCLSLTSLPDGPHV